MVLAALSRTGPTITVLMRRTPIKRTPLRRMGRRSTAWVDWVADNPPDGMCAACVAVPAAVWHHRGQRSTHPEMLLVRANLVALCRPCHQRVHECADPWRSGMLVRSWESPENVACDPTEWFALNRPR